MGRVKRRTQKKTSLKRRNKFSRRRSITKVKSKEPGAGGWGSQKKKRIKKSTKQTGGGWGSPKVYTPEMVGGWGGSNESNEVETRLPPPKTTNSKYGRNFNLSILKQSGGWGGSSRTVYDVNTGKTSLVRKYFKKHFL